MKKEYIRTKYACYTANLSMSVVGNLSPLLFLTFQKSYRIPLSQITLIAAFNFGIQLLIDLFSAGFIDRIGYRASMVLAHLLTAVGFILLTILPEISPSAFAGILLAVAVYAIGGGVLEVLVSPVVEACPSENKEKTMSKLHSFYSWGQAGVVLFSTVFFYIVGIQNWKILAIVWALVPLCNAAVFMKVPIAPLIGAEESGMKIRELFGSRLFWILFLMMLCAGASEQGVSQWASAFAEKGLGLSKTWGDLAGPMAFALLMGTARAFYGKYGNRIDLDRFMILSGSVCILSYLGISLLPIPQLSLIACAVCGLSVGIMWPGTFSKASAALSRGWTAMFALLALGGDIGSSSGPTLVGIVSNAFSGNLKVGILAATIFPILLLVGAFLCKKIMLRNGGKRNI